MIEGVDARLLYKAHVACDEETALIERVAVTPANVNDGKAGCAVVPEEPGEVYADSAYRGARFRAAVEECSIAALRRQSSRSSSRP